MRYDHDKKRSNRKEEYGDDKPFVDRQPSYSVFGIIPDLEKKKLLLVHNCEPKASNGDDKPSGWGLPGGGTEPGETLEQGLAREVYQESGHTLSGEPQLVLYREVGRTHNLVVFLAFVDIENHEKTIREHREIDRVGWFGLDEILQMPHVPFGRDQQSGNNDSAIYDTHRNYIVEVLESLGWLEMFGAGPENYDDCYEEETISNPVA